MHSERTAAQTDQDRLAIAESVNLLLAYADGESAVQYREAAVQAGAYIDTLFDTYAPEVAPGDRGLAKALGGIGLARVELQYGASEFDLRYYSGRHEDRVLAAFHHAGHSRAFIEGAFRYARNVNEMHPGTYGPEAFGRFPIIGAFHDNILGNGRGHDERQSALLANEVMRRIGATSAPDKPIREAIMATTWDDKLQYQSVNDDRPHVAYQRAAAVADLLGLFERRGPYLSVCISVEDLSKKQHGRILTQEADRYGVSLDGMTIDECMGFIDYSPVLRRAYGKLLASEPGFYQAFQPADPRLDELFTERAENARTLGEISAAYNASELTAHQTLLFTREYMGA